MVFTLLKRPIKNFVLCVGLFYFSDYLILIMKTALFCLFIFPFGFSALSQEIDRAQINIDLLKKSLVYETGKIELEAGNATLSVPVGFRFLDKKQSIFVLTEWWGNPTDSSIIGMIVLETRGFCGG